MPELNRANRQVCDVDIRILKTMAPFLFFDTANTTTAGLEASNVYAMKKGSRGVAFADPIQGTMSITAQIVPFRFYALLSDGVIESTSVIAEHKILKSSGAGTITVPENIKAGTLFVYPVGSYGDESAVIAGSFTGTTFTATETSKIAADTEYEIGYLVTKTSGVRKISFNNKKAPKDYFITMNTVDKDENDNLTPFIMTAYKASVQRSFELSFSSEGDPASVTLTFDLLEDKDGNVLDMIEDTSEA